MSKNKIDQNKLHRPSDAPAPSNDSHIEFVDEVIIQGTLRTREVARETLMATKKAMGLTGVWNRISRRAEKRRKKLAKQKS